MANRITLTFKVDSRIRMLAVDWLVWPSFVLVLSNHCNELRTWWLEGTTVFGVAETVKPDPEYARTEHRCCCCIHTRTGCLSRWSLPGWSCIVSIGRHPLGHKPIFIIHPTSTSERHELDHKILACLLSPHEPWIRQGGEKPESANNSADLRLTCE